MRVFYTIFSITLLMGFPGFLSAKQIGQDNAVKVVQTHLQSKSSIRSTHSDEIHRVYVSKKEPVLKNTNNEEVVYYYVFNIGENNGFVIVSGDDIAKPVLGYSNTGSYEKDDLPPGFVYWLSCLQGEIAYAIESNFVPDEDTRKAWNAYYEGNDAALRSIHAVTPFLSTKWGQGVPYNLECPFYGSIPDQRAVTGCVATAMAQLMKYYEYPDAGVGMSSTYTTSSYKISVPSIDLSSGYDWKNMSDVYSGTWTSEAADAVAKLMYHCAITAQTDFGETSGAALGRAAKAMAGNFDYDLGMQTKTRDYTTGTGERNLFYSDSEWQSFIINEVNAERPVFYSGVDDTGVGHAFICDGYDNTGKFHFNWGWDGRAEDVYFELNALSPGTGGTGSGSGAYNLNHRILIGIQPNANNIPNYEFKIMPETGLVSTKTSVNKGEEFEVSARFSNRGYNDFTGFFGVALIDEFENIVEIIGTTGSKESSIPGSSTYNKPDEISCVVSNSIPSGMYKIKAAVKPSYGEWMLVDGTIESVDVLDLEVKANGIVQPSDLYVFGEAITPSSDPVKSSESLSVTFGIYNDAVTDFTGDIDLGIYSSDNQLLQMIDKRRITLSPQKESVYTFYASKINVEPGEYKLALYGKSVTGERTLISSFNEFLNNIDITVTTPTGINDISTSGSVSIYPNPVTDMLYIQSENNHPKRVKVIDLSGRQLYISSLSQSSDRIVVPVSSFAPGTYIVILETDEKVFKHKFIKH